RLREAREDRVAVGALVVPFQVHLTHQVGARLLESLVPLKRAREPADAALAADSADLDRLRLEHHIDRTVRSATSAQTASRLSARAISSCRSPSQRRGSRTRNCSTLPSSRTAGSISARSS